MRRRLSRFRSSPEMEFSAQPGSVIHTPSQCHHHTLPESLTSVVPRRFFGSMILLRTVVAAAAITLAVPAMAQAKSKDMYVGSPPATSKKLGEATVANAFFPGKLTINAGDSVSFIPTGFHNVDIPKQGGSWVPFLIPSGQKVAGSLDAAGAPFWFNGQDAMGPNPALFAAAGFGKKFTYTGAKEI